MHKTIVESEQPLRFVSPRSYRYTAVAGMASVVLAIVAFALLGNAPGTDASGQRVITYLADNRVQLLALVYVFGLSFALILCFLTGLWSILRKAGGEAETLATLGLAGVVVWVTLGFGILLFPLASTFRAIHDPTLARTLADVGALTANLSGYPTAVNMIAFGAAILLTGLLPRWTAWFAFLVAAVHLVSAAAYAHGGLMSPSYMPGLVAPVLYYMWVVGVSVVLWRSRAPAL
ncbi:MAG: hypothetical protein NVS9B15_19350 [Acidobacteriaceae bacterium]